MPLWTTCCRLVRDMRVKWISKMLVALAVASIGYAPIHVNKTEPVVVEEPVLSVVEDSVEIVEEVEPVEEEILYSDEDLEILAIIIYQEAGGDACSDDTRRKVGSVFLNRVNSPLFPNTFEEVATAPRQYGALSKTGLKWPNRASKEVEAHAVQRAYDIAAELLIGGSILPETVIWQAAFTQGDGIYCYQDNTYFCYSEVN